MLARCGARSDRCARALQVDAGQRLGCMAGGAADVRAHVWFQGTAWDAAAAYRLPPPIRCAWHGECGAPLPSAMLKVQRLVPAGGLAKSFGCLPVREHTSWHAAHIHAAALHSDAPVHVRRARPSVAAGDDSCNFDDYSAIKPMAHAFVLSQVEQAAFLGI